MLLLRARRQAQVALDNAARRLQLVFRTLPIALFVLDVADRFTLAEGAVMLDPDVRAYFQDNDAVNQALRALIQKGTVQPSS